MYLMQTVSTVGRSRPTTIEPSHDMDRSETPATHPDDCSLSSEQQYPHTPSGFTLGIPAFAPPNYYVTSPIRKFDPTKIPSKIYTEFAKPVYLSESPRQILEPSPLPKNHTGMNMFTEQPQAGKHIVPTNIQSYLENKEPLYQNENRHKIYELMSPQKFAKPNNIIATKPLSESTKNSHPPVKATKSSDTSQPVPTSPDVKEEKKRKWSLGGLFRRLKKDSESESSSQDEEPRKGFLARRRSRREKRKQRANKSTTGFDHIVKQPDKRETSKERGRTGVNPGESTLSTDSTARSPSTDLLKVKTVSKDSLVGSHDSRSSRHQDSSLSRNSSGGSGSLEGLSRRERLGIIKARAEALRQKGSSSDEDPNNVDNTLHRSGSVNRRSRFARTERYIKRLSRDEESILHREALEKQRLCKSDAEGPYAMTNKWFPVNQEGSDYDPRYVVTSATPSPGQSPLVRHKNLHITNSAPITSVSNPASLDRKSYQSQSVRAPKSYSVRGQSPLPPSCDQKPPQRQTSFDNFHQSGQRSFSYDNNIHCVTNLGTPPASENVMVVQFPVGRISQFQNRVVDPTGRSTMFVGTKPGPPPPPPRDPHRLISSANCLFADSTRPMSYAFEDGSQPLHPGFQKQHGSFISLNNQPAATPMTAGSRSNSENQMINQVNSFPRQQARPRPASVTPEAMKPLPGGRYNIVDPTVRASQFQYYADQTPRSRKPIHIQYHPDQPYLSDSQVVVIKPPQSRNHPVSQVTEFWRQKEQDNNVNNLNVRRNSGVRLPRSDRSRSPSPHLKDSQESPRFKHRVLIPIRPTDSMSSLSGHSDVSGPMKSSDNHDSYESLGGGGPNTDSLRRKDQRPLSMVLESQEHMSLFSVPGIASSPQDGSPKSKFLQDILPNKGSPHGNLMKLRSVQENAPMSKAAMDGLPRTRSLSENMPKTTRVTQKYIPKVVSLQNSKPELTHDSLQKPKQLEAKIPKFMLPAQDFTSTSPKIKSTLNESRPKTQTLLQDTQTSVLTSSKNAPPTPPVRRFSRQLSGSSVEAVEMAEIDDQPRSRKSSNLEDALDELEAIYQSLKLGDEDLLDRAERRDLPTMFQRRDSIQDSFTGLTRGSMSDSGYSYEMPIVEIRKRAPPNRRSGIPDKVMDDMAYRRLHPKDRPNSQNIVSQAGSFILASPVLSQASSVNQGLDLAHLKTSNHEPDTTYDDVVYRNIRHVNNSLKCLDPQPPFGIPLGPVAPSPDNDYLRAKPSMRYRPTFKPRRTPDVVADDLAYRNLRKDSPKDVAAPLTEDASLNTARLKDNNFSLRRRRAVRSLSANLPSLIGRDNLTIINLNVSDRDFEKAQSLTHLPDALEIAQKILEGKEVIGGGSTLLYGSPQLEACRRTERVNNTADRSSLCTTSTSTETLTDSRANLTLFQDSVNKRNSWQQKLRVNIPNNETNLQRPPAASTPERRNLDDNLLSPTGSSNSIQSTDRLFDLAEKSDTAVNDSLPVPDSVPGSPLDEAQLEDLLSALAREARVTSAQLGIQLAELKKPSDDSSFDVEPLHIYEPDDVREEVRDSVEEADDKREVVKKVSELHFTLVNDAEDSLMLEDNNNNMTEDSLNVECEPEDIADTINKMLSLSRERNLELPDTLPPKPKTPEAEASVSTGDAAKGEWRQYASTEGECSGDELPVRLQPSSVPCDARRLRTQDPAPRATVTVMSDRRPADISTSGSSDNCMIPPTDNQRQRAERIATYKEARRKQLASQFASISDSPTPASTTPTKRITSRSAVTHPDDDIADPARVRTTRTSRLRAATTTPDTPSPRTVTTPTPKSRVSPARSRESSDLSLKLTPSSPRKSSITRLTVRSKEDSPPKKILHSDSPTIKSSHADSTRRKTSSHSESPQRKTTPSDSPRRKTSNSDSPQRKTTPSDSPRRKTSNSDSPRRKTSHSDRKTSNSDSPQRKTQHSDRKTLHSDSPQPKTQHSDRKISNSDSPQRKTLHSDRKTSHSDSPQRKASSSSRVSPARSTESAGSTSSLTRASPRTREAGRSSSRGRDPGATSSSSSRRGSDAAGGRLRTPSARPGSSEKEKSPLSSGGSSTSLKSPRTEKDKSSKRKSNLNRSLATEEAEDFLPDDGAIRRRPRRLDASPTALSKGAFDVYRRDKAVNKETGPDQRGSTPNKTDYTSNTRSSSRLANNAEDVNAKLDMLTAITRQNMERLDKVAGRGGTKQTDSSAGLKGVNGEVSGESHPLPVDEVGPADFPVVESCEIFKPSKPSSILKKTSFDDVKPPPLPSAIPAAPVSILKRKTSHEESGPSPPVTFSPSVDESPRGRNSQSGILKKRCSLDESEVLRRRSCSPDVNGEAKPILKRRSSLEELVRRAQSPDPQSILKRRPSRDDDLDERSSSPEPHGILKRKMATATPPTHISIATSVIMSVAGMDPADLDPDQVRPILKKKSSSEDYTTADSSSDTPRPILKKKTSMDTDDQDERPKKTILKSSRKSSQEESYSSSGEGGGGRRDVDSPGRYQGEARYSSPYREVESPVRFQQQQQARSHGNNDRYPGADRDEGRYLGTTHRDRESPKRFDSSDKEGRYLKSTSPKLQAAANAIEGSYLKKRGGPGEDSSPPSSDSEVKPILKHRLSFSGEDHATVVRRRAESTSSMDTELQSMFFQRRRSSHESSPAPFEVGMGEPRASPPQRPLSVAERIQNMEHYMLQAEGEGLSPLGAVPKRDTPIRRDRARFSTQPITLDDFNGISVTSCLEVAPPPALEGDASPRMDANAASKVSMFQQMKAMAEEAQARRKENRGVARHRDRGSAPSKDEGRFQTQPVTLDEVQQAVMLNQQQNDALEAEMTQGTMSARAAKERMFEHAQQNLKSILKPGVAMVRTKTPDPEPPRLLRSVLKKETSVDDESSETEPPRSILKPASDHRSSDESSTSEEEPEEQPRHELVSILEAHARNNNKEERVRNVRNNNHNEKENVNHGNLFAKELEQKLAAAPKRVIEELNRNRGNDGDGRKKRLADVLRVCEDLSSSADTGTSDGESSGGREVKRIIRNEAVARRRQAAINKHKDRNSAPLAALTKSHSQTTVTSRSAQDDLGSVPVEALPLRRSMTQPMEEGLEVKGNASIAERLAALKKSGTTNWQKRVPKLKAEDDLTVVTVNNLLNVELRPEDGGGGARIIERVPSPPSGGEESTLVSDRRGKLETATQGWKKRVGPTDAINFSVAGRMLKESKTELPTSPLASPTERQKKTPRANRFRSKTAHADEVKSMPTSPEKEYREASFKRSVSAPGGDEENGLDATVTRVTVPRFNDETYTTFFQSVTESVSTDHLTEIRDEDLDHLETQASQLVIQRRTVQKSTRKAASSRNPVKTLAARTDLQEEYVQIKTGVAEKELKKLKVEQFAKQSTLAVEALAGLASTEDFTAVSLKKAGSPYGSAMLPFKELMLLHIKGRRHVQTRLVEPCAASINSGDNYVLVTPTEVYNWIGLYSNVIERSRGAEIASLIQQRKDLGCNTSSVITITQGKATCPKVKVDAFWAHLKGTSEDTAPAGHPDEDELYESSIIDTNMVYEVVDRELVPLDEYWGAIPRIEMLDPSKVLVFDFGAELYAWSGKNASLDARKVAVSLASELWDEGFDYSECDICPVTAASRLGARGDTETIGPTLGARRPAWSLLAKVNQHMETVLFREKFLDWPDFSRVIQAKGGEESDRPAEGSIEVRPCDAKEMYETRLPEPDLELEGSHVGRGVHYVDELTSRHFEITTQSVTVWHILEYEHERVPAVSHGQFHAGDSYVVRWLYTVTVTGRELNGQPSRHSMIGRDRCAYFCWQGSDASLNEQGAAALLTVELDHERGPQVRVVQGSEPPAFLNLFRGGMVVHSGRRHEERKGSWRLYMCRGEKENEAVLMEVACSVRQLRSRASLLLLNRTTGALFVWHGSKAQPHTRKVAMAAAERLRLGHPEEMGLEVNTKVTVQELDEGGEMNDFLEGLGGGKGQLYHSLYKEAVSSDHTPRLFHLSSVSGSFASTEIASPYRTDKVTVAFPFLQSDLYSANQPTLFLLDNGSELWLWQGWWPEREDAGESGIDATGSGSVRWQAERRAAMQTAMDYWRHAGRRGKQNAYLVWAGLEPFTFTNLFPMWTDRDDIAELNIRDGRKPGEVLMVESELARLTRSTYPPAQLLQRPLPDGVDPTRLELYLDPQHFQELLGTTKDEFEELPTWKQTKIKKEAGLF